MKAIILIAQIVVAGLAAMMASEYIYLTVFRGDLLDPLRVFYRSSEAWWSYAIMHTMHYSILWMAAIFFALFLWFMRRHSSWR